ncbi:MAG TPA: hypothetical protein VK044_02310 [Virgibacillus sp.]|nr:hypothetical protein [Virgibacillus sp.]
MKSFLEVCDNTREKLGRGLQEKEIEFLQWMYERYEEELDHHKPMTKNEA